MLISTLYNCSFLILPLIDCIYYSINSSLVVCSLFLLSKELYLYIVKCFVITILFWLCKFLIQAKTCPINNTNNQNLTNYAPFLINSNKGSEISPVDDDDIQIIGIKYSSDYKLSPICREIPFDTQVSNMFWLCFSCIASFSEKSDFWDKIFSVHILPTTSDSLNNPEHKCRSQERASNIKGYLGKQQRPFNPQT